MLMDARELADGHSIDCDLCIVGGGAAGMTIARELKDAGIRVVLLEGGGLAHEDRTQALYEGRQEGVLTPPSSNYLATTRLRYLGGTTNHWDGWCRPLDDIDFEKRAWVPYSGWPITRAALEPYYQRAAAVLYIKPFEMPPRKRPSAPDLLPPAGPVETSLFHLSPPIRFIHYREEVAGSPNVDIVLNANVVDIALRAEGDRVERLAIAGLDGKRMTLRARRFVLATGGVENARLLLTSNAVHKNGVGNDRDLVGRFFMDHPSVEDMGQAVLPSRGALMALYYGMMEKSFKHRIVGILRLGDEVQRKDSLLNALFVLRRVPRWNRAALSDDVAGFAEAIDRNRRGEKLPEGAGTAIAMLGGVAEPVPDPASRVTLGEERDELGMRRVHLDWRIPDASVASLRGTLARIGREIAVHGAGRARLTYPAEDRWVRATWSEHHMGTTRMSSEPSQGVVDADCRVHGVENLFVAGSSVFSTGGCSNPTVTIVALAIRLADHLRKAAA